MSENRVIGRGNAIPWHFPEDFKWFRKMTTGNVVVMGRKTFESLKGALPNRTNLVVTRHPQVLIKNRPDLFGDFKEWRSAGELKQSYQMSFSRMGGRASADLRVLGSLERLNPSEFSTDLFICGGAEVYAQMLPRCSDLYLTLIKAHHEGDAFFPPFEEQFNLHAVLLDGPEFQIRHYRHRSLAESLNG